MLLFVIVYILFFLILKKEKSKHTDYVNHMCLFSWFALQLEMVRPVESPLLHFYYNYCEHHMYVRCTYACDEAIANKSSCVCAIISKNLTIYVNTLTFTLSVYMDYKSNRRRKTQTIFFHLLLFVSFFLLLLYICDYLALATNNCVVHFSRFSPLTVLFCPSHDVSVWMWMCCVRIKRYTVLLTQHKWKFLLSFADLFSLYGFYYTNHRQISWSCLLSVVPFQLHM